MKSNLTVEVEYLTFLVQNSVSAILKGGRKNKISCSTAVDEFLYSKDKYILLVSLSWRRTIMVEISGAYHLSDLDWLYLIQLMYLC